MRQTNESDSRTQPSAAHLLSGPGLCAALIPIAHTAHPRFAGNQCNDNRPTQLAEFSIHTGSHRKRIHQWSPYTSFTRSNESGNHEVSSSVRCPQRIPKVRTGCARRLFECGKPSRSRTLSVAHYPSTLNVPKFLASHLWPGKGRWPGSGRKPWSCTWCRPRCSARRHCWSRTRSSTR